LRKQRRPNGPECQPGRTRVTSNDGASDGASGGDASPNAFDASPNVGDAIPDDGGANPNDGGGPSADPNELPPAAGD